MISESPKKSYILTMIPLKYVKSIKQKKDSLVRSNTTTTYHILYGYSCLNIIFMLYYKLAYLTYTHIVSGMLSMYFW